MTINLFKKKKTEPSKKAGSTILGRLKQGLSKTRDILFTDIDELFSQKRKIDDNLLEEIEESLIMADLGVDLTLKVMENISKKSKGISNAHELKELLKNEIQALFPEDSPEQNKTDPIKPRVIMVVGVNGTGKTTTLGKLAMRFNRQGQKVLIAAADTFRAAAIEQVSEWAARANVGIVKHRDGSDPAAVAFDGVEAALARGVDILLIDTAGRLHTQKNLMEELKKIKRTIAKRLPGAPHEVLMVLDATTGQNAISQATLFNEAVGVTALALTKLDGTAKGGIAISISGTMKIPLKYIGLGEGIDDLEEFNSKQFINALFEKE
ncbi:MAG: signal recognition particle-docking protein FtsY [Desulfobacterium sp.]|nr:signal recognition particle-docking protein FtsY [Desulfobacterium sp.]